MKDTAGEAIAVEAAVAPCLADWDGDGDLDMIAGFMQGPVRYFPNESVKGKLQFGPPSNLTAAGGRIEAPDGGPCAVDWDGDGALDLILGDGQGRIVFYRGTGTIAAESRPKVPTFAPPVVWIAQQEWNPESPQIKGPGIRTKPCVGDWNADGKLDLIVGDFLLKSVPPKKLTPAEEKRLAQLDKEYMAISKQYIGISEKVQRQVLAKMGVARMEELRVDQRGEFTQLMREAMDANKEFQTLQQQMNRVTAEISKLRPTGLTYGHVWVYLRK